MKVSLVIYSLNHKKIKNWTFVVDLVKKPIGLNGLFAITGKSLPKPNNSSA